MNQEALGREFKTQEIPFKSQPTIQIYYKGQPLDKTYQPDFVYLHEKGDNNANLKNTYDFY